MHPVNRPGRLYLPQLDAMRFFAFVAVFWTHSLPSMNPEAHVGWMRRLAVMEQVSSRFGLDGVGLFFLLSAYLITRLLTVEREATGSIHLKQFYVRRALRIWPVYYLILLIGIVVQPLRPDFHLPADKIVSGLFFFLNWNVAMKGFVWNPMYPLWTVSCEEQFYVIWPLMMKLLSPRRLMLACYVGIVVVLAATYWPHGLFLRTKSTDFAVIWVFFPLGSLLALMPEPVKQAWRGWTSVAVAAGGLALWQAGGMAMYAADVARWGLPGHLVGRLLILVGTVMLFYAFLRSPAERWSRPFVYLGKISYGLYVYHLICVLLVAAALTRLGLGLNEGPSHFWINMGLVFGIQIPVSFGFTVLVAWASYRWFETPFLRLKERFALIHTRAI